MPQRKVFFIRQYILSAVIIFFLMPAVRADQGAETAQTQAEEEQQKVYPRRLKEIIREEKKEEVLEFSHQAESFSRFSPLSGVDKQSGKVEILESEFEYNYTRKLFEKLPIEFSLDTKYFGLNNSTVVKLPAHLTGLSASIDVSMPFFNIEKTYFRVGLTPFFNTDNWSCYSSSFRLGQRYFVIWQPDDQWTWIAGVGAVPDYDTPVFPIFGFIYNPNNKWTFNLIPTDSSITYALNDKVTLFAEADFYYGEFEVGKDGIRTTVLEYTQNNIGLGASWRFNKYFQASLSVGGALGRQLKYKDSLGKVNIDNNFYSEIRIEARI